MTLNEVEALRAEAKTLVAKFLKGERKFEQLFPMHVIEGWAPKDRAEAQAYTKAAGQLDAVSKRLAEIGDILTQELGARYHFGMDWPEEAA